MSRSTRMPQGRTDLSDTRVADEKKLEKIVVLAGMHCER